MGSARDIERSVAFYAKFGLKPSKQTSFYAEIEIPGGTVLGLHLKSDEKDGEKKPGSRLSQEGVSLMLRVKDIEKAVTSLKEKKVVCGRIQKAPGGAIFSKVKDPDGNRLLLLEMPSQSEKKLKSTS
jgi:predicted enzyme related to lactoylglutathione lyase